MRQIKNVTLLSVLATFSFIGTATADQSQENAFRAVASWSAFECSALASMGKDAREQERLFTYALEQGRKFIAEYAAGKIKEEHLSNTVPWGFLILLEGPSADFMLGRIYESAQDNALKDVITSENSLNPEDLRVMLAQTKFQKKNCRLIGK